MAPTALNRHVRAEAVVIDGRCFIDGQRVGSVSGETFVRFSPLSGRSLGHVNRRVWWV